MAALSHAVPHGLLTKPPHQSIAGVSFTSQNSIKSHVGAWRLWREVTYLLSQPG